MSKADPARTTDGAATLSLVLSIVVPSVVLAWTVAIAALAPNAYSFSALAAAAVTGGAFAFFLARIHAKKDRRFYIAYRIYTGYYAALLYFIYALERTGLAAASRLSLAFGIVLFAAFILLIAAAAVDFFTLAGDAFRSCRGTSKEEENKGKHGVVFQVFDTIHAFIQAALIVIVINIFIFQIFQVPSESMVSSFMINDRPLVLKFMNGPKFPLSDVKLPTLRNPQRGDIVVFRNPRYERTEQSEFKRFCSQLVYMVTFSAVNLDKYGADGELKADPLVKRVIGVPGEKIMMVDDKVYIRKKGAPAFRQLTADAENWAQTDDYRLPEPIVSQVRSMPITADVRAILDKWDAKKNELSAGDLGARLEKEYAVFSAALAAKGGASRADFERSILAELFPDHAATLVKEAGELKVSGIGNAFQNIGIYHDELLHLYDVLTSVAAREDLKGYVLSWKSAPLPANDPYAAGTRKLNLLFKENLVALMTRDLELTARGLGAKQIVLDTERNSLIKDINELYLYTFRYYDMRNFPATPAGADEYIAPNRYFVMGDNRYNSLDFRFSTDYRAAPLDVTDPVSIYYETSLDPKAIEGDNIEGIAVVRLWPFTRFGAIRHAK